MSLETQLRDALAARADAIGGPDFDPYERVAGAVVAHRRRRRAVAVGAVAAAAAIAVLVPGLAQDGDRATLPAKRTQVVVPGPDDPRWVSYSSWPTRGSLATDTAYLAEARQLTADNVLYAGDLDRSRVLVTWAPDPDGTNGTLTLYSAPLGSSAEQLAPVASSEGPAGDVVALRENADNDSRLVVLTRPGAGDIGISRNVQIGVDGTVAREGFLKHPTTDGVYSAVVEDSPPYLTRVMGPGGTTSGVSLLGPPTRRPEGKGTICLSCTGEDFRSKAELAMGEGVANTLGIDPGSVTSTTRYFGPVDTTVAARSGFTDASSGQLSFRLIVVDTTLPGGQVLRSAIALTTSKDGTSASTSELSSGAPIEATTADRRPFVVKGLDPRTNLMSYQVFAPGAARVRMVSDAPTIYPPSASVPVRDGSAVLQTPMTAEDASATYEVVTYDGSGRETGRWPVDLPAQDRWAEGGQS